VSFLQLEESFGLLEKTFLHRGVLLADGFREGAEFFLLIGVEFGGDFDLDADVEVAAAGVAEGGDAFFAEPENGAALSAGGYFD
jgi:hypothetical protein